MKSSPRLFILIPVLNEAGNIVKLMGSLKMLSDELAGNFEVQAILIDDGSSDQTSELAARTAGNLDLKLEVLRHQTNQGPGHAFGTGFKYLTSRLEENDLVMTMEGDNTSRIDLVKQMLHRMEEGYEIILASPYLYGGRIVNTSSYRVLLSSVANLFIKELLGLNGILTVSSFFRLYKTQALKKLQLAYGQEIIERAGFECMVEMLMKIVNLQMTISEVPMLLDTHARVGKSRMKIMRTIRGYLALCFLQRRWRKMASRA